MECKINAFNSEYPRVLVFSDFKQNCKKPLNANPKLNFPNFSHGLRDVNCTNWQL